ncbi:hypothetical protein LIER_35361 [Lithospermum erythrorhizon]|uniref:Uncharacterized protein n=1 Tax=Lithospermum erythrorhizon TaxID=34254 RepID=A0AAV3NQR4_LITER
MSTRFPDFSFYNDIDTITNLIQIKNTPFHLQTLNLNDHVSALELKFNNLKKTNKKKIGGRKYTWTAEIKSSEDNELDQKYKWVVEVKDGKKKGDPLDKSYKFSGEIKGKSGKSDIIKTYKFEASSGNACESSEHLEKKVDTKKNIKKSQHTKLVEITDAEHDHGGEVLRQAFCKRVGRVKEKQKELSPQDAVILIQMNFRAYLIQRSQALRAFRELAIAKTKLKEIKTLFKNFTYRRRVARDAEELQRFNEKIVVLLLTVDAIEV